MTEVILKRWRIEKKSIDEADVEWLRGCCHALETKYEFQNLFEEGRPIQVFSGPGQVFVDTINNDQEAMLKLKYGGTGQLILMRVERWEDGSQQMVGYVDGYGS